MGTKLGALLGVIIVVILIAFAVYGYNTMGESGEETIRQQSTSGSIQETLIND